MKRFVVVLTVWAMGLAWALTSLVLPVGSASAAVPVATAAVSAANAAVAVGGTSPLQGH
jgi:hypothetical protein